MEISRFPSKGLLRMPGSTTTQGQHVSRDIDTGYVAFCWTASAPNLSCAAQYLAYALNASRLPSGAAVHHWNTASVAEMVSATVSPVSRAASVTRDLRSCKTSTGRVHLQMMRSPSQMVGLAAAFNALRTITDRRSILDGSPEGLARRGLRRLWCRVR
jgi:hypothetical protein